MYQIITQFNSSDEIFVRKPISFPSGKKVFQIRTGTKKERLVLQTPKMYLPYSPLYDDKGYVSIDLCLFPGEKDDLVRFLSNLYSQLITELERQSPELLTDKTRLEIIKPADSYASDRIKLRNVMVEDIHCFTADKEETKFGSLRRDEPFYCLFLIESLWVYQKWYGLQIDLVQVRTCRPDFGKCLIETPQNPFEKYSRMKKTGVPQEAISHCMRVDGLSETEITQFFGTFKSTCPPPPPLPSSLGLGGKGHPVAALLNSLKNGSPLAGLKKVSSLPKKKKMPSTLFQPPSTDDLLSKLKQLKKVNTIFVCS
jgi:hypothetical protein